jgi:Periplasmic binding protein
MRLPHRRDRRDALPAREQDRIVGISGYVVRPPQARREKLRVSAFTSVNIGKIIALKPDLVLTFSDLQADIAMDLIRRGLDVHAFNQRSIAGILDMIRMLGAMVDANERTRRLVEMLEANFGAPQEVISTAKRRPKRVLVPQMRHHLSSEEVHVPLCEVVRKYAKLEKCHEIPNPVRSRILSMPASTVRGLPISAVPVSIRASAESLPPPSALRLRIKFFIEPIEV